MRLFELTIEPIYDDPTLPIEETILMAFDTAADALDMRQNFQITEVESSYPEHFTGLILSIKDTANKEFFADLTLADKELFIYAMREDLIVQTKALVNMELALRKPLDKSLPIDYIERTRYALEQEHSRLTLQVEDTFWRLQHARMEPSIMVTLEDFLLPRVKEDFLNSLALRIETHSTADAVNKEKDKDRTIAYWQKAPILKLVETFEGHLPT